MVIVFVFDGVSNYATDSGSTLSVLQGFEKRTNGNWQGRKFCLEILWGGKLLDIAGLHDRHNCMIGSKSMLCYLCNTHVTPLRHTHETWTSSKHRVFEIYMHIAYNPPILQLKTRWNCQKEGARLGFPEEIKWTSLSNTLDLMCAGPSFMVLSS